jgi:class 3 adenylate cyclase
MNQPHKPTEQAAGIVPSSEAGAEPNRMRTPGQRDGETEHRNRLRWQIAPKPENEAERLAALNRYQILDTAPEVEFEDLVALAAHICGTPIALISMVDTHRQWFKSKIGTTETETPRDLAFCSHAILQPQDMLVIPNALEDDRFADNPFVTGETNLRFYAGTPLVTPDGFPVGTLCTMDQMPRYLTPEQLQALQRLGRQVIAQMELRLNLRALEQEQQKVEDLLLNILPQPISEQLKQEPGPIAQGHDPVTILFADLVNFTGLASHISPAQLVGLLNEIFSIFDRLTEERDLEKIKTIGDAYMVAGGLPTPRADHAQAIADFALAMLQALEDFNRIHQTDLHLRVGINSGPVVAGVIGTKKFIYDLWGDAVNTASRMESHGLVDRIQVSESTYELLKQDYDFEPRGPIPIKGKGEMLAYLLIPEPRNTAGIP